MEKVKAICTYKDNRILSLTIIKKDGYVKLMRFEGFTFYQAKQYPSFNALYQAVLNIIKANNFYVDYHVNYNRRFYDIFFIEHDEPYDHNIYGYRE